jgi:hypothetical protein
MRFLVNYSLLLSLSLSCLAAWGKNDVKSDTLDYLKELRNQNVKRLREIDQTLSNRIEETQGPTFEAEVSTLQSAKKEHMLRQEFLDRLIFQVDTKFRDGDLRAFMERSLVEMAKVDVSSQTQSGLWKFLKYAADAVRRLPEQKENIVAFLEGYMNRSVADPIRPEDYLSTRNYTNGAKSESGKPLNREDVGAVAERRIQDMAAPQIDRR